MERTTVEKIVNALENPEYLDYTDEKSNRQYVIIKKSRFMATLDFIVQMTLIGVAGMMAIGLLILAF